MCFLFSNMGPSIKDVDNVEVGKVQKLFKNCRRMEVKKCRHPEKMPTSLMDGPRQQWYFVTKIVLTYCEKKLF